MGETFRKSICAKELHSIYRDFKHAISPWVCHSCHHRAYWKIPFCKSCLREWDSATVGKIREEVHSNWDSSGMEGEGKFSKLGHFQELEGLPIWSLLRYDRVVQSMIHGWKYRGEGALPIFLRKWIAHHGVKFHLGPEINFANALVPIPMFASKQRERGFNQALVLAKIFSTWLNLPVEAKALQRKWMPFSQPQAKQSRKERKSTVSSRFQGCGLILKNKSVILIDDVVTTGSTLNAAAEAIHSVGGWVMGVLTLAYTPDHRELKSLGTLKNGGG